MHSVGSVGEITSISNEPYNGFVAFYASNTINFVMVPEMEIVFAIPLLGVRTLQVCGEFLLAVGLNGVKVYNGKLTYC